MVTGMEKPYVVGMDIGGTNTVFGIVDSRGNVLATDSVKTQSFSKIEDYVEAVSSKLMETTITEPLNLLRIFLGKG